MIRHDMVLLDHGASGERTVPSAITFEKETILEFRGTTERIRFG